MSKARSLAPIAIATVGFAITTLAPTTPAAAHHGAAQFDASRYITIEGTIKEYRWGNPHVYLTVMVQDAAGQSTPVQVEAAPASQLMSRGVTRDLLRVGDRVSVRANPLRSRPGYAVLGYELSVADGSHYPLTTAALRALGPANSAASSIAGTWVPQPERFMTLMAAVRGWSKTDLASKAMAENGPALVANRLKCIPQGAPFLMSLSVPIAIRVNKSSVTLDIDFGDDTRRVVALGADHPAKLQPTLLGHSVGRWEGTTLVIDTSGYAAHPDGLGYGFPSSTAKRTIERLALSDDRKHIDYLITVEDPTYLSKPVQFMTQWDFRPGQAASNAGCDSNTAKRYLDEQP
jgi:hypothetical protein